METGLVRNDASKTFDVAVGLVMRALQSGSVDGAALPGLIREVHDTLLLVRSAGTLAQLSASPAPVAEAVPVTGEPAPAGLSAPETGNDFPFLEPEPDRPRPAVPVENAASEDSIRCLECGKSFQTLKRHIGQKHGVTEREYRARWGLGPDFPLTAPSYTMRKQQETAGKAFWKRSPMNKPGHSLNSGTASPGPDVEPEPVSPPTPDVITTTGPRPAARTRKASGSGKGARRAAVIVQERRAEPAPPRAASHPPPTSHGAAPALCEDRPPMVPPAIEELDIDEAEIAAVRARLENLGGTRRPPPSAAPLVANAPVALPTGPLYPKNASPPRSGGREVQVERRKSRKIEGRIGAKHLRVPTDS